MAGERKAAPGFLTWAVGEILKLGTLMEEQFAGSDDTSIWDILSLSCKTFAFGAQVLKLCYSQSYGSLCCLLRADVALSHCSSLIIQS